MTADVFQPLSDLAVGKYGNPVPQERFREFRAARLDVVLSRLERSQEPFSDQAG
jgi:hypothetical protein